MNDLIIYCLSKNKKIIIQYAYSIMLYNVKLLKYYILADAQKKISIDPEI